MSDSHGSHLELKVPDGDILVHCGDLCSHGGMADTIHFLNWFNTHPHRHKVFIAGNHDWIFEKDPGLMETVLKGYPDLIYLNDTSATIEGLKFHGSPVSPRFFNWAFNRDRGEDIKRHWDMIPQGIDVLITHGPAYGFCDEAYRVGYNITEKVGCQDLLDAIKRVKPSAHLSGHIHYSYGVSCLTHDDGTKTMLYNCSVLNEDYVVTNQPWIINL